MGDYRLPKRIISEELENAGQREPRRGDNRWAAGQRIAGCLASRGTGMSPH